MDNKIVFFFGAGAEYGENSFGLPSGGEYTLKTMQQKNAKLYTELKKFYNNRVRNAYVEEYKNSFLFEKDSHTFREIIYRAALECAKEVDTNQNLKPYKKFIDLVKEHHVLEDNGDKSAQKEKWAEIKEEAKNVYDLLIKDYESNNSKVAAKTNSDSAKEKIKEFKDYLMFYGAVEKDFSAIIDPNRVGLTQFWRVINYYWSAFFTILQPMCEEFSWYRFDDDPRHFYENTLNDLPKVIDEIYSNYDYSSKDDKNGNYYKKLSEKYPESTAITTNYTPFIEHYFGHDKSIYLAGKLSEFEYPQELCVKDIRNSPIENNCFVFPFLMTQAPVKPIIVPGQIREYGKALDRLQNAETLIIIGYSLGQADNHINAMLREYVLENKKVIYCYYTEKYIDSDAEQIEKVKNCLKLPNTLSNIIAVSTRGNAKELLVKLENILHEKDG